MQFSDLLTNRVRADGARPLITSYAANGDRTELSATTFANWVDKTANLLVDTLGLDPGEPVAVRLARGHPGHWMTLVWHAAIWRAGLLVDLVEPGSAAVEVLGPQDQPSASAADHLACSLHPFGMGFSTPLAAGVIDWAAEVKGEPDLFAGTPPADGDPAWQEVQIRRTYAQLVGVVPIDYRILLTPADPWAAVAGGLLGPLLGGGSAVVMPVGTDAARVAEIGRTERAEAR